MNVRLLGATANYWCYGYIVIMNHTINSYFQDVWMLSASAHLQLIGLMLASSMASRHYNAKPLLQRLYWLPIKQWIVYKTAVLTFKVRNTATQPTGSGVTYRHVTVRAARHQRSSGTRLLSRSSSRTNFAARGFRHSAPAVWNSLPRTVLVLDSLSLSFQI